MKLQAVDSSSNTYSIEINLSQKLGEGATATIYKVTFQNQLFAAKIYKADRRISPGKLEAMLASSPPEIESYENGQVFISFTWIKFILKDRSRKIVGFLMPFVDQNTTNSLDTYYDPVLIKRLQGKAPSALSLRLEIALNLCKLIDSLHSQGHHFIDIKPQNIRVYKDNNKVVLMDCDGYSIKNPNSSPERFPADLISTDYIAPEVIRNHLSPQSLGEEQDRYGLAVILFQLLNFGTHPFQGIVTDQNIQASTNDDRAANWLYPHGLLGNHNVIPRKQSVHDLIPIETRTLFDQAFTNLNRPSAGDWYNNFNKILSNKLLTRCVVSPNDVGHIHFKNYGCIGCRIEENKKSKLQANSTKTTYAVPPINQASNGQNHFSARAAYQPNNQQQAKPNRTESKWPLIGAVGVGLFILVLWIQDQADKNISKSNSNTSSQQIFQSSPNAEYCDFAIKLPAAEICSYYKMNTYPVCQDKFVGELRSRGLVTTPIDKCGESPAPYTASEAPAAPKSNDQKTATFREKISYLSQISGDSKISYANISHDIRAANYYSSIEDNIFEALSKSKITKEDGLEIVNNFQIDYISSMTFSGHVGDTCSSQSVGTVTRCIINSYQAKCQNIDGVQYKKICLQSVSK